MTREMDQAKSYRAPSGTRDLFAEESRKFEAITSAFSRHMSFAGYGLLETPLFEEAAVFKRSIGQGTDVVNKEMYEFEDKGGRLMSLRPEMTASCARAFVQHSPPTPWRVRYAGPMFRYERPQAGRYRQFYQLGAEVFGTADPEVDTEVIWLAYKFIESLGIRSMTLKLNSLGDANCRPQYREKLVSYLSSHRDGLCDEHRDRLSENPMRVLDCKRPECVEVAGGAPVQIDHLCDDCAAAFRSVTEGLSRAGVAFELAPRLVRGLDYYMRTTFEISGDSLASAQNALGGGGRYDGLVESIGGPQTPGIGFSLGIERLLLACDAEGVLSLGEWSPLVFVVCLSQGEAAIHAGRLIYSLWGGGVNAQAAGSSRSTKAQMRAAGKSGAALVAIVGDEEAANDSVSVRIMNRDSASGLLERMATDWKAADSDQWSEFSEGSQVTLGIDRFVSIVAGSSGSTEVASAISGDSAGVPASQGIEVHNP